MGPRNKHGKDRQARLHVEVLESRVLLSGSPARHDSDGDHGHRSPDNGAPTAEMRLHAQSRGPSREHEPDRKPAPDHQRGGGTSTLRAPADSRSTTAPSPGLPAPPPPGNVILLIPSTGAAASPNTGDPFAPSHSGALDFEGVNPIGEGESSIGASAPPNNELLNGLRDGLLLPSALEPGDPANFFNTLTENRRFDEYDESLDELAREQAKLLDEQTSEADDSDSPQWLQAEADESELSDESIRRGFVDISEPNDTSLEEDKVDNNRDETAEPRGSQAKTISKQHNASQPRDVVVDALQRPKTAETCGDEWTSGEDTFSAWQLEDADAEPMRIGMVALTHSDAAARSLSNRDQAPSGFLRTKGGVARYQAFDLSRQLPEDHDAE